MQMLDGGEGDDKIIGVAANDPAINYYENIEELPKHFFSELRHFFEEYKMLENKTVKVNDFGNKAQAMEIIKRSMTAYKELINS
jgi:inorganic pyrophosphatase